jgi:ferredoxin-NADP reductase
VFVATGTGIAPFVSMARSGVGGFVLLHGVRTSADLYYERIFRAAAGSYVPCLSRGSAVSCVRHEVFFGRVNEYIEGHLPRRGYDFYLSGRGEMIRDVTLLVDDLFPDSRVYSEIFF